MEAYSYLTLIVIAIGFATWYFIALPADRRIEMVRQWLLVTVSQIEKEIGGGGLGAIKLSKAYDMFITKFPFLSKLITFKQFESLVDEALKDLEALIEKNVNVENYIKYDNKK